MSLKTNIGAQLGSLIKTRRKLTDYWFIYTIPALVIYIWFMAFPLFNSMRLSLYTGTGLVPTHFVGLKNYVDLFTNPLFRDRLVGALLHTCILFAICMGIQNTLGLLFANILSSHLKGHSIYRTVIFLPATVSVLVTGFLWRLILNPNWGGGQSGSSLDGLYEIRHFSLAGKSQYGNDHGRASYRLAVGGYTDDDIFGGVAGYFGRTIRGGRYRWGLRYAKILED